MPENQYRVVVREVANDLEVRLQEAGYDVITPRFNDLPDAAREAVTRSAHAVVAQVTTDDSLAEIQEFSTALDAYEAQPDTIIHALDGASHLYERYGDHVFDEDIAVDDIAAYLDDRYDWETVPHVGPQTAALLEDTGVVPGHVTYDRFKQTLEEKYENTTTARKIANKLKRYAPDTFSDLDNQ